MKYFLRFMMIVIAVTSISAQKRAITIDDLWNVKRLGNYTVSPDGKLIAFAVTSYNMETNKGNSDIWIMNSDGTGLKPLKNSEAGESAPKFSPDGKKIAYEMKGQIWLCDLDGKNDEQLTTLYTGASGLVWHKNGKGILFVSSVYPECDSQECNEQKDKAAEANKVKAKIFDELYYRNFNDWRGEKVSHLFAMNLETKEIMDLTKKSYADVPPIALGGHGDYTFAPDEKEVALTINFASYDKKSGTKLATSTNNDVIIMNPKLGIPYQKISTSNGNDNQPVYSPDGKYLAFLSMERAGFEADKLRLMLYDRTTKQTKDITAKIDISIGKVVFSPDSKFIYFDADRESFHSIYKLNIETSELKLVVKDAYSSDMEISPDGSTLYFKHQSSNMPIELCAMDLVGGEITQLTSLNKDLLAKLDMNATESFWTKAKDGVQIQSLLIKPPFFDANKKYPLLVVIHGGPQGTTSDQFHFRWNLQLFASKGYVVIAPNFRGSTGFGQKFTDAISGDWGGKPYTDIMNCVDNAIKQYKFIDSKNLFAAGGSYGGYMTAWISTQTDRFNALICHAGVFNLESMYGTTEQLWFPEWDNKGTPWSNKALYDKFSPHRYAKNVKTPVLVVQGGMDFRVPEEQAFQHFTYLQRRGVPSKFLYFPDETHFVLKPQNSRLWYNTVFEWIEQFKK
ncbi:MAG: S9 family peptidase [Melioribacteraceae bacterium]